jgi:predicted transcriptional regulator
MAYSQPMQQKKITFRAARSKIKALDSVAEARQCNRSFVLNEALDQYLAWNEHCKTQIEEGLRQIRAGESVSREEVRALVASLTQQP